MGAQGVQLSHSILPRITGDRHLLFSLGALVGMGNTGRGRTAVPSGDPRRLALLEKDFMRIGYIEGISDDESEVPLDLPDLDDGTGREDGVWDGQGGWPGDDGSHGEAPTSAYGADEPTGLAADSDAEDDLVAIGTGLEGEFDGVRSNPADDLLAPRYEDMPQAPAMPMPAPEPASSPFASHAAAPMSEPAPAPKPPRRMEPVPPMPDGPGGRHRRPGRIVRTLKRVLIVVLALAMFAAGFIAGMMYEQSRHPSVSAAVIETQLAECSDLATAKMHYNGLVHYESGDIPLINKKTFSMTYQAEVRAGIDLSQADVQVANGVISVRLPKATIQTASIDQSSVKFFDQTWSLFNWESKDDAKTALEQAQKDLENGLDDNLMIEEANLNAKEVVRGLIAPTLKMNNDYRLEITTE